MEPFWLEAASCCAAPRASWVFMVIFSDLIMIVAPFIHSVSERIVTTSRRVKLTGMGISQEKSVGRSWAGTFSKPFVIWSSPYTRIRQPADFRRIPCCCHRALKPYERLRKSPRPIRNSTGSGFPDKYQEKMKEAPECVCFILHICIIYFLHLQFFRSRLCGIFHLAFFVMCGAAACRTKGGGVTSAMGTCRFVEGYSLKE